MDKRINSGPDRRAEKEPHARFSAALAKLYRFGSASVPRRIAIELGKVFALTAGAAAIAYAGVLMAMPDLNNGDIELASLNRPSAYTFLNSEGDVIGHRGGTIGEQLTLRDMPAYLPAAFLTMEDRNFYTHLGIDPRGMARAALVNFKAGHVEQGGSTITQQTVKMLFLDPDRTMKRKVQEMFAAWALENNLSKDEILALYLNRIYLGSGAYGVDGAAQKYFGKSARNVTLAEAAMLAALTRAPSAFSPHHNLPMAQERMALVLDTMVKTGDITHEQRDAALANPPVLTKPAMQTADDDFLDAAAEEAEELAPYTGGDLTVTTTIDERMQQAAAKSLNAVLDKKGKAVKASQGALVAMTPDGAVRALIGGRAAVKSAFNRATLAHRQPGSAFKPFVYLAALERGMTPQTTIDAGAVTIKGYAPQNYDAREWGVVSLDQALKHSINTVAVKLGQQVGTDGVIRAARQMGITSPLPPYASLALGTAEVTPIEITAAYAGFAAGGMRVRPYLVMDIQNQRGETVYRNTTLPPRAISEDLAKSMNAMMFDVVQSGTGTGAALGEREAAGKTGTSADYRDAWFVGFTANLVAGVWVGNDDNAPMKKVTGGALPAEIWHGFMVDAHRGLAVKPLLKAVPPPPPLVADVGAMDGAYPETPVQDESTGYYVDNSVTADGTPAPDETPPSVADAPREVADAPEARTSDTPGSLGVLVWPDDTMPRNLPRVDRLDDGLAPAPVPRADPPRAPHRAFAPIDPPATPAPVSEGQDYADDEAQAPDVYEVRPARRYRDTAQRWQSSRMDYPEREDYASDGNGRNLRYPDER